MKFVNIKSLFRPKISKAARTISQTDLIGQPDPLSNLRPIIQYRSPNETFRQKQFADYHDFVQNWNQRFWENHNKRFAEQRRKFVDKHNLHANPNSDQMSEFYRNFLDETYRLHLIYNYDWYKHNFKLLRLAYAVGFEKFRRFLSFS